MGYTHYWNEPDTNEETWNKFLHECEEILEDGMRNFIVAGWDGEEMCHLDNVEKDGISFNGWGDDGHETCSFPSFEWIEPGKFTFCKTEEKPYDLYVTACLAVFHDYFGNVRSDGNETDWVPGVALANDLFVNAQRNEFENPMEGK